MVVRRGKALSRPMPLFSMGGAPPARSVRQHQLRSLKVSKVWATNNTEDDALLLVLSVDYVSILACVSQEQAFVSQHLRDLYITSKPAKSKPEEQTIGRGLALSQVGRPGRRPPEYARLHGNGRTAPPCLPPGAGGARHSAWQCSAPVLLCQCR